jgi:uncharacterized membrane protein (UPF0127 family)
MSTPPAKKPAVPQNRNLFAIIVIVAAVLGVAVFILVTGSTEASAACPAGQECVTAHTDSGEHVFTVEWATDPEAQTCGLMYREEMAADHGMIFDFDRDGPRSFWMMNTFISLDMVFIRDDGTVVNVAEHTTPRSPASVPSTGPARYVLELNAGTADRIGLEPGDRFDLARGDGMTGNTAVCAAPPA